MKPPPAELGGASHPFPPPPNPSFNTRKRSNTVSATVGGIAREIDFIVESRIAVEVKLKKYLRPVKKCERVKKKGGGGV